MKTKLMTIALLASAVMLLGCEETDRAKALNANPVVVDIGTFDGCSVKFVNRGWKDDSFYIARCDTTVTQTRHWDERQGKTTVHRQSTMITKEIEKLQAEKAAAETKEKAIAKLTPEERTALGLK